MTEKQQELIEKEIEMLCDDEDNFMTDNYGSLGWENGEYEVTFSWYTSKTTLENFAKFVENILKDE